MYVGRAEQGDFTPMKEHGDCGGSVFAPSASEQVNKRFRCACKI